MPANDTPRRYVPTGVCAECGRRCDRVAIHCLRCEKSRRSASVAVAPAVNASGRCLCGCGLTTPLAERTVTRRGWVKGEPTRYIPGHQARGNWMPVIEDRGYETPCWIWQGSLDENGYGRITFQRGGHKRSLSVHVMYFEDRFGPSPTGTHHHHKCRVRSCVNPAHLEPLTASEHSLLHAMTDARPARTCPQRQHPVLRGLGIDGLVAALVGKTVTEVATAIGADRSTVYDFLKSHGYHGHPHTSRRSDPDPTSTSG